MDPESTATGRSAAEGGARAWVLPRCLLAMVLLAAVASRALAQEWRPPIRMVSHVIAAVEVLGVKHSRTTSLARGTVDASPGRMGRAVFALAFEPAGGGKIAQLEVALDGASSDGSRIRLRLVTTVQGELAAVGPVRIRRERQAEVQEGSTLLHQVFESDDGDSSIVLLLTADSREVPELVTAAAASPVVFHVSLTRTTDAGPVMIEENVLRTLDGSPVSYAFRVGAEPAAGAGAHDPTDLSEGRESGGQGEADSSQASVPAAREEAPSTHADPHPAQNAAAPKQDGAPTESPAGIERAQTDEVELTLLPTRSSDGILLVEATLQGRSTGGAPENAERALLLRRTQVVTRGGSFELTLGKDGPGGHSPYRFLVSADF